MEFQSIPIKINRNRSHWHHNFNRNLAKNRSECCRTLRPINCRPDYDWKLLEFDLPASPIAALTSEITVGADDTERMNDTVYSRIAPACDAITVAARYRNLLS